MSKETKEKVTPPQDAPTMGMVLDAVRELTTTVSDLVEQVEEMRKEYGLKKRAGVFTGKVE